MKKIGLFGFLAGICIVAICLIGTRNSLVNLSEEVEESKSIVETTLQRRLDLIPNLVATVKGYSDHEEKVFTEIAEARSKLSGSITSGDIEQMDEANSAMNTSLGRLLAITENYPELKASQQYIALQDELAGTENRIAIARQDYSKKVREYNTKIKRIPTNVVASLFGFNPIEYYEASAGAQNAPVVNFE